MNTLNAKDVFEILVRANADMLIAYIRAAVHDDAAADDIFQETMLTAWRRLADYDKQRPFGPWLRGIAGRLILSHFRKSTKRAELCEAETLEYLSSRFEQLQQLQGDTFDDKMEALRDCTAQLPDAYREAVRLRYTNDLGPTTIAERLKIATEAVKKRLQRAKSRLLDCINQKLQANDTPS